jgi:hypothetical protein
MPGTKHIAAALPGIVAGFLLVLVCRGNQESADELTFSHKKHLARGAACSDCHATASSSRSADDRLVPDESTCLRCHDGEKAAKRSLTVPTVPAVRRTYRFNHELHVGFGNMAPVLAAAVDKGKYLGRPGDMRRFLNTDDPCIACHRGVAEVDLATSDQLPHMADCLVCHSRIELPFSCGFCHTADAVLRPASHTAGFSDAHSSREAVPDKSACKVCHGLRFTCMGCH